MFWLELSVPQSPPKGRSQALIAPRVHRTPETGRVPSLTKGLSLLACHKRAQQPFRRKRQESLGASQHSLHIYLSPVPELATQQLLTYCLSRTLYNPVLCHVLKLRRWRGLTHSIHPQAQVFQQCHPCDFTETLSRA